LRVEELFELPDAVELARFALHLVRTAEAVRERNELGAIRKVTVAAPVAVAGGDGGGAEGAAVIAAHEREIEILACRVADELQRILHRLRAAHVEVHAPLDAEPVLHQFAESLG